MVSTEAIREIAELSVPKRSVPGSGLSHEEVERRLRAIGCIRVIFKPEDRLIVYYPDDDGTEQFVYCAPNEFLDSDP